MIYDVAIVGGGIIGLATARELKSRFPKFSVAGIEKEGSFARHQTGHNSGVLHSGIYYKPGSLKATLCREGRALLLRYCDEKALPYRQAGKLIVATNESELPTLQALWQRGTANGLESLALLNPAQIREREPHVTGLRAIWSPETAIVDFARIARALADDAEAAGVEFQLKHEVIAIARRSRVTVLHTTQGEIQARYAIACAGLYADRLARMSGAARDPQVVPFRGDYLRLKPERAHLVRGNVYPVPDPRFPFLGAHFTPNLEGQVLLGPNAVLAFAREGYSFFSVSLRDVAETIGYRGFRKLAAGHWRTGVAELRRDVSRAAFVEELRRFVPELTAADCSPGPSGVRAQGIDRNGNLLDDFLFEASDGILHVRNAPSPGATSSLAIARYIVAEAERRGAFENPAAA